ncbi:MAG: hypothetical protein IJZ87_10225 [Bacteroidales bacterium]|nr:hypothetical protein [Bacteroidales bacterium]
MNLKVSKQYKRQAVTFADSHEWVSFKYRIVHYFNDSLYWDIVTDVIIKYDDDNSMVFINDDNDYMLVAEKYYKRIDKNKYNIYDIKKNRKDKNKTYQQLATIGKIHKYFQYSPFFMKPIDFAYSWALWHSFYSVDTVEMNNVSYNKYRSKTMGFDCNVESYINNGTNFLDSIYMEWNGDDFIVLENLTFYDVSYENRQGYIDSIFNFNNTEYSSYSRYDEFTMPLMTLSNQMSQGLLDYPLVNLDGDTTFIREQEGWILLNLWTTNCGPCLQHLKEYSHEKDSLGYRILENEGIKILAIEHRSSNLEHIRQIVSKYNSEDITYSAKDIGIVVNIPTLGYYYLVSPNKEIVYETGDLGDYEEILKIIRNTNGLK